MDGPVIPRLALHIVAGIVLSQTGGLRFLPSTVRWPQASVNIFSKIECGRHVLQACDS